jgi:methionyl-tRNA synthetase
VDGHCIEHPTLELIHTRERNHFFRLSAYGQRLLQLIATGEFRVEPEIRRNEVVRLLEDGLQDVSISRQRLPWGIPFPGDPEQTVYVWFDALINYLSATGFPEPGFERLWPADLHVVGKGITRFHCIIWPAMLLAAGLGLPRMVWAHGYVQWEGAKMSKTAGTVVSVGSAIERHGADALRYFLLREVGFEGDGNFTWDRFDARYIADLADTFGNLVSRSLSMTDRYRGGIVPKDAAESGLEHAAVEAITAYSRAMDACDLQQGAALVIDLATRANRYVEETAPWKLVKAKHDAELDVVLASLVRTVARLAVLATPFIPVKAEEMWTSLGADRSLASIRLADLARLAVAGWKVSKPPPLFPKPDAD